MSSKLRALFCLLCLVGCAVGCSVRFDRPAVREPNLSVRSTQTQCLSHFAQDIQDYFEARASAEQVEAFWDCATRSLEFFTRYVKGRDGNTYSPYELKEFLEEYFLGDLKISPGMLAQSMKFKQMLFGRSTSVLSDRDIADIDSFLRLLKKVSLNLRPYIGIYTLKIPENGLDRTTLESSALELENAVEQLTAVMAQSQTTYRLEDLQLLLTELQRVFDQSASWQGPAALRGHMPVFNLVRTMYTGGDPEYMKPTEWGPTLHGATRVFFEWLRYKYTLGKDPWRYGDGLESITHFLYEGLQILEEGVSHQPDQQLSYAQMHQLFDLLGERQWLPLDISASTYKSLLVPVFSKMLRPLEKPNARVSRDAITLDVVQQAQLELRNWYVAQKWIADMVPPKERLQETVDEFSRPRSWRTFNKHFGAPIGSDQLHSINEMKRLMYGPVHLLLDSRGVLRVNRTNRDENYDLYSLSALNWRRLIIRLALRGYVRMGEPRDPESLKRALTLDALTPDEFRDFYNDVRALGIELHFLDPREHDLWQNLADEADVFTFRGNGDGRVSFEEGVEIMTLVFSSGTVNKELWAQIQNDIQGVQKSNPHQKLIGDEDVFGVPKLDATEFMRSYKSRFLEAYGKLHSVASEYERLRDLADQGYPEGFDAFFNSLEKVGRSIIRSDIKIESGNLDKFSMMLHYVEVIYMLYDHDADNQLSAEELIEAFPRFRNLLRKKAEGSGRQKTDEDLRKILTYMAAHGRVPDVKKSWGDLLRVSLWMNGGERNFLAPPLSMIKLFADVRTAK